MHTKILLPIFSIVTIAIVILLASMATKANESLELMSSAFVDWGELPAKFTCEGEGISPPLNWTGVPTGTKSFVVIMDHIPDHILDRILAPNHQLMLNPTNNEEGMLASELPIKESEGLRWYWSMYNISAQVSEITIGQPMGTQGSNVVNNKHEYSPPCSKGPGPKNYTFHLYALSTFLDLVQSEDISATTLRNSMKGLVLDSDSITVSFARSCQKRFRLRREKIPQKNRQPSHKIGYQAKIKIEPPLEFPPCL